MARFDSAQRTEILEAAILVFAEQGLEGAAIRKVGQAAGVSSAMLYYYFEDKHTLFVEAVRRVMLGLLDHLAQRRRTFADGQERLAFLVDGLFDYYGTHPARLRLMAVAFILHPELLGGYIQDIVKEGTPSPLEVLQEGVDRHQLKPLHPAQAWWSILGLCLFSLKVRDVIRHVDTSTLPVPLPDVTQTRRQIIRLLCNGLAVPKIGRKPRDRRTQTRART